MVEEEEVVEEDGEVESNEASTPLGERDRLPLDVLDPAMLDVAAEAAVLFFPRVELDVVVVVVAVY